MATNSHMFNHYMTIWIVIICPKPLHNHSTPYRQGNLKLDHDDCCSWPMNWTEYLFAHWHTQAQCIAFNSQGSMKSEPWPNQGNQLSEDGEHSCHYSPKPRERHDHKGGIVVWSTGLPHPSNEWLRCHLEVDFIVRAKVRIFLHCHELIICVGVQPYFVHGSL